LTNVIQDIVVYYKTYIIRNFRYSTFQLDSFLCCLIYITLVKIIYIMLSNLTCLHEYVLQETTPRPEKKDCLILITMATSLQLNMDAGWSSRQAGRRPRGPSLPGAHRLLAGGPVVYAAGGWAYIEDRLARVRHAWATPAIGRRSIATANGGLMHVGSCLHECPDR
jgi:hypothetical protein